MTDISPAEREAFEAFQFFVALESYADGAYDVAALARAARRVVNSTVPFDPDIADRQT
jgi:hypothetical protein